MNVTITAGPARSVESYARLWQKHAFHFFRMIRRPHVPRTRYFTAAVGTAAAVVYSTYRDRTRTKKKVTPLESSHCHHRPARAASARAARGRRFDPKRAATAPGCLACSASREHRAGSLLIVWQDQTQTNSSSSARSPSTTPDDGSHPPHRPSSMPY